MAGAKRLIMCSECGEDTINEKKPVYEDFRKVGNRLFCASCGHEFNDIGEVPFKEKKSPSLFDEDVPSRPGVFAEEEDIRNCRRCRHYIVNPFTQRCGLHFKPVEATDICDDFEARPVSRTEMEGGDDNES